MIIIIFLIALSTIFNLILWGLVWWSGANPEQSGLTVSKGAITSIIATVAIIIQLTLTYHHINLL